MAYASEALYDDRGLDHEDLARLREIVEAKLNSLNAMCDALDGDACDPLTLEEFLAARRGTLQRKQVGT